MLDMNFLATDSVLPKCYPNRSNLIPRNCILCILSSCAISLTDWFEHARWWDQLAATLRVLGMQMAADRNSRHHRHPTSRNTWLPKLSYCANSSKGNSSEVDAMTTSPSPQRTQISLGHNLLCSTGRRNHLMRTLGLRQSNLSLTCW